MPDIDGAAAMLCSRLASLAFSGFLWMLDRSGAAGHALELLMTAGEQWPGLANQLEELIMIAERREDMAWSGPQAGTSRSSPEE